MDSTVSKIGESVRPPSMALLALIIQILGAAFLAILTFIGIYLLVKQEGIKCKIDETIKTQAKIRAMMIHNSEENRKQIDLNTRRIEALLSRQNPPVSPAEPRP